MAAPPPPAADLVSRLARLDTIGRCLASALTALVAEDEDAATEDDARDGAGASSTGTETAEEGKSVLSSDDGSGVEVDPEGRGRKRPRAVGNEEDTTNTHAQGSGGRANGAPSKIDDELTEHLLKTYGDAVASTDWYGVNDVNEASAAGTRRHDDMIPRPPPALLKGKIKHYNRIGRQWRIVATDVEIRPRVSLEEKEDGRGGKKRRKITGRDRLTLWEKSLDAERQTAQAGRLHVRGEGGNDTVAGEIGASDATTEGLNFEGDTLKLDGDVLILAYNDV